MALNTFRMFIASPGDINDERSLAEDVIGRVNRSIRDTIPKTIDARKWEHLAPVTPDLPEERIQEVLNREVEQCQFFVLILYKRYGRIEPGHALSNTEREVQTILRAHERDPKLRILAYFKDIDGNVDPGEQEVKVRDLRARLGKLGVAYRAYKTAAEFERLFTHDLYDVVLRIHLSPFKVQALKGFWQFGDTDRPYDPQVAVIYPPMPRSLAVDGHIPDYWLKRLLLIRLFQLTPTCCDQPA